MNVPNLLESSLRFHKSNGFGPSLGAQFSHPLMEIVTVVFIFFFSWGSCLCLEGSFLDGAADWPDGRS